ncbi:MAG: L-idonate 5-dehydrogenase [Propionibacteriaceae bacterium]|nr:L-idonate 5-dehydrogenase [Propionibacteriaceae bacterium]
MIDVSNGLARALVLHGPNDLRVEDVPVAVPGDGEALVEVAYGGICGSDLHYAIHGRGSFSVVTEPLILGHELSARVAVLGPGTAHLPLAVGDPVAVNPATNCGVCPQCRAGRPQTCGFTRYLGSAATKPHVQGGLIQYLVTQAELLCPLPAGVDLKLGALAEPFAVAVHGVRRAGNVAGCAVLVTGAGPIGLLAAVAARAAGAATVAITDLQGFSLGLARQLGFTTVLNVAEEAGRVALAGLRGQIDVAIEASGAVPALRSCLESVRAGGTVVQLGMLPMGDSPIDVGQMMARELDYRAALRFGHEFPEAVRLLGEHPELRALITHIVPLETGASAIAIASDRSTASKVLIDLTRRNDGDPR